MQIFEHAGLLVLTNCLVLILSLILCPINILGLWIANAPEDTGLIQKYNGATQKTIVILATSFAAGAHTIAIIQMIQKNLNSALLFNLIGLIATLLPTIWITILIGYEILQIKKTKNLNPKQNAPKT